MHHAKKHTILVGLSASLLLLGAGCTKKPQGEQAAPVLPYELLGQEGAAQPAPVNQPVQLDPSEKSAPESKTTAPSRTPVKKQEQTPSAPKPEPAPSGDPAPDPSSEAPLPTQPPAEPTQAEPPQASAPIPAPAPKAEVRTFTVAGSNFTFAPAEIKVKKGDTVKIVFQNNGGFHDWMINEFNAKTPQIQGGQSADVTFVADKAGTFEYYCSVGSHRAMGMKGNLIVE